MFFVDYHTHTSFSYDSEATLDSMCEKAIEIGLKEIAFTDHLDLISNRRFDWSIDLTERNKAIEHAKSVYREKIKIINGIELGQPQANKIEYKEFLKIANLDFIIGSIHNLKGDREIEFLNFDSINCEEMYDEYMNLEIELAQEYDFDVLGHITLPQRYMYMSIGKTVDLSPFEKKYKHLFEILRDRGKGIEVNTSGLRKGAKETLPSVQVLQWYRQCGGEIITIGSDTHSTKNLSFGIKETYELLKDIGFKYIMTYEKRRMKKHII